MIGENLFKSDAQLGGLLDAFGRSDPSVLMSALDGAIGRVTIRTQVTPAFSFDPFAVAGEEGEIVEEPKPSLFDPLSWLKPEITIETAAGPQVIAPYGHPDGLAGLRLLAAGGVLGGSIAWWFGVPFAKYVTAGGALVLFGPTLLEIVLDKAKSLLASDALSEASA